VPVRISPEQIPAGFAYFVHQIFEVGTGFVANGFRFVLSGLGVGFFQNRQIVQVRNHVGMAVALSNTSHPAQQQRVFAKSKPESLKQLVMQTTGLRW
jgi:hypothetical protein